MRKNTMVKFSKKLLGKKLRTAMVMHRLVVKIYANGMTIKPWKSQGVLNCPTQEELFLTTENIEYLKRFIDNYYSLNELAEKLYEN